MKIIIKILFFSLLLMFSIVTIYILYAAKEAKYSNTIPVESNCENLDTKFNLETELKNFDLTEIKKIFPYESFLDSGNYCNAETIENSLKQLNELNPNQANINREVLIHTLTNKLQNNIINRFKSFNPDSLIIILQWADEFKVYEKTDIENGVLYGIVYDHWMGFISNQLRVHYENDPSIRFNFKFKYLQSICQSKRFAPAVGMSNVEKVVEYTLRKEYTYLFNRFWNGTGIFIKLILFAIFCIFIYMLYCSYQHSFKKQNL